MPTSSRILFHLSRLMAAVSAANLARCGCRAGWRLGSGYGLGAGATSTAAIPLHGRSRAVLEQLVPTSSRLILHLSRLKIAVPAANLVRWRALSSSGWGRALKRAATPSAGSRAAPGARERRGAACAHLLPDIYSLFPVNGCRSGRESGSLRLPGWAAARQWVGFGAPEGVATSTAAIPLQGRARAARSSLCRPPPG